MKQSNMRFIDPVRLKPGKVTHRAMTCEDIGLDPGKRDCPNNKEAPGGGVKCRACGYWFCY
jgi:hypothetical protein